MTMFTDHSDLADMAEVAKLNAFRSTGTRYGYMQSFWASVARTADVAVNEVLEISFADRYLINSLQFDVAKYPHTVRAQRFDESSGLWQDLVETGGSRTFRNIHECVPRQIPPPSSVPGHQHPQHAFKGHWRKESFQLAPTETSRIRLVFTRINSSDVPTDLYGNVIDYSLAVRDLVVGYQVTSLDDVPRTLPADSEDGSYFDSFADTDDAVSSSLAFALRKLGADRAVRDNSPDLAWKCEPQPDPQCVVSFYADVRTAGGEPQVIDRIFLDPINNGGHVTAYFAHESSPTRFLSQDCPLRSGSIRVDASADITVDGTGMSFGSTSSLILDNRDFNYETGEPWWTGMVLIPFFDMGISAPQVVLDCGAWNLAFTGTGMVFSTDHGESITLAFDYQSASPVTAVISYDGEKYGLWLDSQLSNAVGQTAASATPSGVEKIALGSSLDRSSFGGCKIAALVIKNEMPTFDGSAYQTDPRAFSGVEKHVKDEPETSRFNAVLRFDPQTKLQSSSYPWCLFGGTPSRFEAMQWTPVNRDYIVQRGWMELPAIRASYWKLEFTGLPPIYSDVFLPVARRVRRFPAPVLAAFRNRMESMTEPTSSVGDDVHQLVASHTNYLDTPIVVSTGGTGKGYTNTEVFVAEDHSAADRLYRQFGADWNYQQRMSPYSAPRFDYTQVHLYDTELVSRTSKVAYQVGLRSLRFGRTNLSAKYDSPQYEEMFYDTDNLESSTNWSYDPQMLALTSGQSASAQIVSRIYHSNRKVRGIQFAAQQTPPRQLLPDAEFEDPAASSWSAVGDARLGEPVQSTAFGQLIPVRRTLATGYWEDIAPRYGTWGGIEAAGATWGDLASPFGGPVSSAEGNGIVSETVDLPAGGYLYAASRVISDRDLFAPLWLQIVDSISGDVLAESEVVVRKGQVTEWFTIYELGTGVQVGSITWGEIAGEQHFASYLDTFTRPDATSLGRMDSGQSWVDGELWDGSAGTPLHVVSNNAEVTATGQRSEVDLQTPWGSLTVQVGTVVPGTGEMINLGGIAVLGNGDVVDTETGHTFASLTLSDNDELLFEFMPTSQVPLAHTSGADASILSWSVVITQNSSFVETISTARPVNSVRALSGAIGQSFQSFSWVPNVIVVPLSEIIEQNPVPRDGAFNSTGDTWVQGDGKQWFLNGAFNQVDLGIQQELQAPVGDSFSFDTDVGSLYGALTTQITPSGTTPATDYFVLKLDDGPTSLYLRANGDLVQFSTSLGYVTLAAGVVPSFADATTVLFAETAKLSSTFRTAHSLSLSFTQTLVFLNGDTVVGTYQGNSLWTSTMRGVMGTDGSTVVGFTWAPDLGENAPGSGARTWDEVSGNNTRTWDEVSHHFTALNNSVKARVVQKIASNDEWYMDSLPIFADPIVWEFSNDGGDTYLTASPIRNNPKAVALLPVDQVADRLRYRVTSYAQHAWVSHLVMRPWYIGHMHGVPIRPEVPHGPNLGPLDGNPPVEEDPNFMVWNLPIPREWWFAFRSLLPGVTPAKIQFPVSTEREIL